MTKEIDETDKKILCMLSEDPRVSQAELSERLNISQPAVSARIRKLEEKGVLVHLIGTDVKKAQIFMAKAEITTDHVEQSLKFLESCPLFLNCFLTSGRHNMTCFLIGENIRSIMSCLDYRLRRNLPVKEMEFDLIVTPTRPLIIPVKPRTEKKALTPCGADCSVCDLYKAERCLGCPASIHYKGKLL